MGIFDSVGSVVGGIAGQAAGAGARGRANDDMNVANQIMQELQDAPDISKPLILQRYKQVGVLTPEMEQYINTQLPSTITTDPSYKNAQMQALQQMQERANTGLTQGDRAALQQAQLGAQGDTNSRLASIQSQMQQQGLSDSGTSLAMKLAAAQGGANTEASNANQLAQSSQQAREQALSNLGQYGSQLQNQDFSQQAQQQAAMQQMQRFNTQNQMATQQANVNAANQAQAANLANAQNTSNMNVNNQNQELNNQLNRSMAQTQFNNNVKGQKAGALTGNANWNQQQGNQQAQGAYNTYAGLGQVAQGIAGAYGGGLPSGGDNLDMGKGGQDYFMKYGGGTYAHGGQVQDYREGGQVQAMSPNQKARVQGDSYENDKIPAMLSEHEIVVPRTLSQSKLGKHILKIIDAHNNLKNHMNGNE